MRTATLCMLSSTLAAISLSSHQVGAAALNIHTEVPKINVHLPPPKANTQPSSPKVQVNEIHFTKKLDKSSPTLFDKSTDHPKESVNFNYNNFKTQYNTQNPN